MPPRITALVTVYTTTRVFTVKLTANGEPPLSVDRGFACHLAVR